MRPKLEMAPQAVGAAWGTGDGGLGSTGANGGMLGTAACHCGPGRTASPRYTCTTCARFALVGCRIQQRAPHLLTERRRAA